MTVQQAVPFLGVSNMEASLRFYVDGLGFKIQNRWMDEGKLRWCWLQLGGGAVMLQEFRTEGHDAWKPEGKVGEGVTLYFICDDALAYYLELTERRVTSSKPFVSNGMWVTRLNDPDGYRIAFESATDAPEESQYEG
jgi:catechol 2,3-dioxygenase-like lactoylglutathione lyase family enzyme